MTFLYGNGKYYESFNLMPFWKFFCLVYNVFVYFLFNRFSFSCGLFSDAIFHFWLFSLPGIFIQIFNETSFCRSFMFCTFCVMFGLRLCIIDLSTVHISWTRKKLTVGFKSCKIFESVSSCIFLVFFFTFWLFGPQLFFIGAVVDSTVKI